AQGRRGGHRGQHARPRGDAAALSRASTAPRRGQSSPAPASTALTWESENPGSRLVPCPSSPADTLSTWTPRARRHHVSDPPPHGAKATSKSDHRIAALS